MPLIIVPTPIGNLDDMSLRGLHVLQSADVIACEDTRHTLGLLNHYGIKKPLISCHEHNESVRVDEIIKRLQEGQTVALVSDAGTPGLSDPGQVIIRAAIKYNLPYDVLPGANALLPALLLSGLNMDSFYFAGFLKGTTSDKKARLEELKNIRASLVFYMAPHKLLNELELMASVLGDREAALVREISKIHQETIKGTLVTFGDIMTKDRIRGEFVCVVGGASAEESSDDSLWQEEAIRMFHSGESTKNVANSLSIKYCIPRNRIKRHILEQCAGEVK